MEDQRISKSSDPARGDRDADSKKRTASTEQLASPATRRSLFREFSSEVLPTPSDVPGWRFTWLSTENKYDPVHRRLRIGYELVKASELPNMENFRVNSGIFEGCVQVNEMILAKIPEDLYQEIMAEFHFHAPNAEEQRLKSNTVLPDEDRNGRQIGSAEGDGYASLGEAVRRRHQPTFD